LVAELEGSKASLQRGLTPFSLNRQELRQGLLPGRRDAFSEKKKDGRGKTRSSGEETRELKPTDRKLDPGGDGLLNVGSMQA